MLTEQEYFAGDAEDRRVAAQIAARLSDQLQGFTDRATTVYQWLRQRESLFPYRIKVGNPTVAPQDDPSAGVPATRTGPAVGVSVGEPTISDQPSAGG